MTNPRPEGEDDGRGREAAGEEEGATIRGLDALPELAHARLLVPDGPGDEGRDLPIQRIPLVQVEGHRLVGLVLADERPRCGPPWP